MPRNLLRTTAPAALLLALTGCGAEGTAEPVGAGAAGGACLSGATECADIPTGTGGVTSQPDGSVLVADVVGSGIDGPFIVKGYALADEQGARLCATLLESLPPQCGQPSIELDLGGAGLDGALEGELLTEDGVTWSQGLATLEGQVVDGVFVVGAP